MRSPDHQSKQKEIIDVVENQIKSNTLKSSVVIPVEDFENDSRICLTSVHLPDKQILSAVQKLVIEPLREIEPSYYYYPLDSLHLTIKNVRVINDPPHFSEEDVEKVKSVFSQIVPRHKQFRVYFYKLLLFPNNLALVATSDEELDNIVVDLDNALKKVNVPDDKKYVNSKYFFCNITLARFSKTPSEAFKRKIKEISESLSFKPYNIDSVTLVTANAVLKKLTKRGTWNLKK
jgi:hypothetical protein